MAWKKPGKGIGGRTQETDLAKDVREILRVKKSFAAI